MPLLFNLNKPISLPHLQHSLNWKERELRKLQSLFEFDKILGLSIKETWEELKQPLPKAVEALVQKREELRAREDFGKADELRQQVEAQGFEIRDTPKGPLVKRKIP